MYFKSLKATSTKQKSNDVENFTVMDWTLDPESEKPIVTPKISIFPLDFFNAIYISYLKTETSIQRSPLLKIFNLILLWRSKNAPYDISVTWLVSCLYLIFTKYIFFWNVVV